VWDGDCLPAVKLDGAPVPGVVMDLEGMLLGESVEGQRSWLDRMTRLRDGVGAFRLAYLESLIRAADERASADPREVL
jgi:CRISPR-associated endonuclease/helicase Cas3